MAALGFQGLKVSFTKTHQMGYWLLFFFFFSFEKEVRTLQFLTPQIHITITSHFTRIKCCSRHAT